MRKFQIYIENPSGMFKGWAYYYPLSAMMWVMISPAFDPK